MAQKDHVRRAIRRTHPEHPEQPQQIEHTDRAAHAQRWTCFERLSIPYVTHFQRLHTGHPRQAAWRGSQILKHGLAALTLLQAAQVAQAWTLTLVTPPRRLFLHVGNGSANANNATINLVRVSVPTAGVGTGTALPMASNSTQATSLYDGAVGCPSPASMVMIGASYQRASAVDGLGSALLSVSAPPSLSSADGASASIPIGQISWSTTAPGASSGLALGSGAFAGGTQTLAVVPANRYAENCLSFRYGNTQLMPAGTYRARVTYTISSP